MATTEWDQQTIDSRCVDFSDLLSKARAGETDALGQLLQWFGDQMGMFARRNLDGRLRRRVNPSDVVQEAMLAAHRDFDAFRGQSEGELFSWLRTILIHVLHDHVARHLRVQKRDLRREVAIDEIPRGDSSREIRIAEQVPASTDSPSECLQAAERREFFAKRLQELKPEHARVIQLRILECKPFEEVAAELGRSCGATRMLFLRALDALRKVEDAQWLA